MHAKIHMVLIISTAYCKLSTIALVLCDITMVTTVPYVIVLENLITHTGGKNPKGTVCYPPLNSPNLVSFFYAEVSLNAVNYRLV